MTSLCFEATPENPAENPLDIAEQILLERDWVYDRPHYEETLSQMLLADFKGDWGDYRMQIEWHATFGALTFVCHMDIKLAPRMTAKLYPLLAKINPKLWLGHFDISEDDPHPCFRYAMLLKGKSGVSLEQVEDLLDIAVAECERFYPAFQSLLWSDKSADDVLQMALLDTQGEA